RKGPGPASGSVSSIPGRSRGSPARRPAPGRTEGTAGAAAAGTPAGTGSRRGCTAPDQAPPSVLTQGGQDADLMACGAGVHPADQEVIFRVDGGQQGGIIHPHVPQVDLHGVRRLVAGAVGGG